MENIDLALLNRGIDWLNNGEVVIAATVAKTWGSSPRPAGSMMIWRRDGQFEGSLSGGCIEEELLARFADNPPDKPQRISYGITKEQAVSRGLPCGGEVTVVVETVTSSADYEAIIARLDKRERVARTLDMHTGDSRISTPAHAIFTDLGDAEFRAVFEPKWRLLVVGAGQLSAYVTQFADLLGYEVLVCDPRENYRHSWLAGDIAVSGEMPDDFVQGRECDAQTGVVALTHDPKLDDLAIMEALNSPAFYVGALGSSRTNKARRERLREHFDVPQEQLDFMCGPIGIDLNTRTASEIGLAIMTEITARRNGVMVTCERPDGRVQKSA